MWFFSHVFFGVFKLNPIWKKLGPFCPSLCVKYPVCIRWTFVFVFWLHLFSVWGTFGFVFELHMLFFCRVGVYSLRSYRLFLYIFNFLFLTIRSMSLIFSFLPKITSLSGSVWVLSGEFGGWDYRRKRPVRLCLLFDFCFFISAYRDWNLFGLVVSPEIVAGWSASGCCCGCLFVQVMEFFFLFLLWLSLLHAVLDVWFWIWYFVLFVLFGSGIACGVWWGVFIWVF